MKLFEITPRTISFLLSKQGVKLRIGSFNVKLKSTISSVARHLCFNYGECELLLDDDFIDFHVEVVHPSLLRRFFRPQVNFSFEGYFPFKPLPYAQAAAFFEWGLNWCVASHSNQYLIIHAAVVERGSQTVIFAGTPGSGKSTLCAALVCSGWRLLSDEMALLSVSDGLVYPIPRPVSLKNQSIDLISDNYPHSIIGPLVRDTSKGSLAHMRPPVNSVQSASIPARPSHLVFPKYQKGHLTELTPLSKSRSLLKAAENCFNYHVLGLQGFQTLGDLCDRCCCYEFRYSQLNEAVALFSELSN